MIALVLALCIFAALAIRPALEHDDQQPIQVTGKAQR